MPSGLVILCILLITCSAALITYWGAVAFHIWRTMRRIPTCRAALGFPEAESLKTAAPSVCMVVPAHNESAVIGGLVHSLLLQDYPNLRVVFALDRCTDATADTIHRTAADHPRSSIIEIVEINECPPGWAGKVHAIHCGVTRSKAAANADLLIFADADTVFFPGCIRATVALMQHRSLAMLSVLSTLTAHTWFERIVQPAASFELMRQYPIERANAPASERRAFANGQFIMFTRAAYAQIGGHEACKDAVLEDIQLARMTKEANLPAGVFLADGMLACRMYASWAEFERGWKRIYIEGANRKVSRLKTVAVRTILLGTGLPLAGALAIVTGLALLTRFPADTLALATATTGAAGLFVMLAALAWSYAIGRTPVWAVPAYPIGAAITARILWTCARDLENRVPTTWAGRTYVREAR